MVSIVSCVDLIPCCSPAASGEMAIAVYATANVQTTGFKSVKTHTLGAPSQDARTPDTHLFVVNLSLVTVPDTVPAVRLTMFCLVV